MKRAVQKRTLETRARLIAAAEEIVARDGYEALRVEEVVLRAGVAKGTFFAHFRDKDVLMERLIGPKIDAELDRIAALP
ncbi:MAG: helix-turn-helix domain-containing protein, partial [Pseudomonadota bacterium]